MAKPLPNRLRINVTQRDIEIAVQGDPNNCPVANNLRRTYPQGKRIEVNQRYIALSDNDFRYKWHTPLEVIDWIRQYDALPFNDRFNVGPLKLGLRLDDSRQTPIIPKSAEERAVSRAQAAERKKRQESESKDEQAERISRNNRNRALRRRGIA